MPSTAAGRRASPPRATADQARGRATHGAPAQAALTTPAPVSDRSGNGHVRAKGDGTGNGDGSAQQNAPSGKGQGAAGDSAAADGAPDAAPADTP
jgi:hypothetical protein